MAHSTSQQQQIIQRLTCWGDRQLCDGCCDGFHDHCLGFSCTCYCRDPRPKPKRRPLRGRDGLTEFERRQQAGFAFDPEQALKLTAEALINNKPNKSESEESEQ